MASTQSYANHTRWYPVHHFVAAPIIAANLVWRTMQAVRQPTGETIWTAVVALGLVALLVAARMQALTVQNRVVRLEMRLRLATVLPPDLAARVGELRLRQLLGLRFASDAELPELVRRALAGELASADAIKREVKSWQPDHLRA
jgi:hypothetical protein